MGYESDRGSNEIGSTLLHFVNTIIQPNYKQISIFCDSCPGQNKKYIIFFLYHYFALKYNTKLKLYSPERGYSFLPSDRDFGLIGRKIKKRNTNNNTKSLPWVNGETWESIC